MISSLVRSKLLSRFKDSFPFVILSMTTTAPVKLKKDGRGYRVEKAVKGGAGFAPFISTLDSFFNAPIIERGLKRSAFC